MARRARVSGVVAREAERGGQVLRPVHQLPRHQLAHPDHPVAVARVGDDVGVLPEGVEDREAVRCKAPCTWPSSNRSSPRTDSLSSRESQYSAADPRPPQPTTITSWLFNQILSVNLVLRRQPVRMLVSPDGVCLIWICSGSWRSIPPRTVTSSRPFSKLALTLLASTFSGSFNLRLKWP